MNTDESIKMSKVWEDAASVYAEKGFVLVLGAGVSRCSGFPTWKELIQMLGERCIGAGSADLINALEEIGYSYPEIAGIIRSTWDSDAPFLELVREELYRNFPFFRKRVKYMEREFVDFVTRKNSTLQAVAALCAVRSPDGGFISNPRINAVVNFNLDAVLREYTESRYSIKLLRTIERASAPASSKKINTYYIHGFLQFDPDKIGNVESESNTIVFTEDEYYDFFGAPFGMFSYTLLHLLREYPCFFIGLSMIDENLRRLLYYSYSERVHSYEAERRPHSEASSKSLRHFASLCHSTNEAVDRVIEQSLANIGVRVAWVDDFKKLPDFLGMIYESSGTKASSSTKWSDVYEET